LRSRECEPLLDYAATLQERRRRAAFPQPADRMLSVERMTGFRAPV
jgi:hypothetical protein